MKLCLHVPVNQVSFGQLSTLLLREVYNSKELDSSIFLIGNSVDLASQKNLDQDFLNWLQNQIKDTLSTHDRNTDTFKLWHLNGSLESISNNQTLLSFYELDQPTKEELNIARNQKNTIFTSTYTNNIFKEHGCKNTHFIPLPFDKYNFGVTNKTYHTDDRIIFNLCGKLEKRKHHKKVIRAWLKKYGNNSKYFLQCSIYNPFIKAEDQQKLIYDILEGKNYFNISFLGMMQKNEVYNDYLNSADIILGMSGGEGWGLPEFQSVAMGKHGVILNAHAYKDWANKDNATMVEPSGKIEAYDNMFFQKGSIFNQGNIYDFNEDDFISACDKACEKVRLSKINKNGLKLQDQFTTEKFLKDIINVINK